MTKTGTKSKTGTGKDTNAPPSRSPTYRSFKEQGIEREPTIHIGAVANALERKGIQTERDNINREIIRRNMMLEQAKAMLELAEEEVNRIRHS